MKLTDLDRVLELLEGVNYSGRRALGGDGHMKATMKAVCHDSGEALTLLREMRENAVEGFVHPDATGLTNSYMSADFWLERPSSEWVPTLLLITPEDE